MPYVCSTCFGSSRCRLSPYQHSIWCREATSSHQSTECGRSTRHHSSKIARDNPYHWVVMGAAVHQGILPSMAATHWWTSTLLKCLICNFCRWVFTQNTTLVVSFSPIIFMVKRTDHAGKLIRKVADLIPRSHMHSLFLANKQVIVWKLQTCQTVEKQYVYIH